MNQQKLHQNEIKENIEKPAQETMKRDESKQRLASIMEKIRQKKQQLEESQKLRQKILDEADNNKNPEKLQGQQQNQQADTDLQLKKPKVQSEERIEQQNSDESISNEDKNKLSDSNSNQDDVSEDFNSKIQKTIESDNQNSESSKNKSKSDYERNVLKINELDLNDMRKFVLNPPPKGRVVQVSILRDKSGIKNRFYPKYHIFFSENINCHVMSVKKKNTSKSANYTLSLNKDDFSKRSPNFLGKLTSNFIGTEFFLYDNGQSPKKQASIETLRNELAYIKYEKNLFGIKGPRKLRVITPQYNGEKYQQFRPIGKQSALVASSKHFNTKINCFMNNPPQWNEEYEAFVLDFYNRVDKASVKNFQLIEVGDTEHQVLLQFGKIGDHIFNLDFSYPFSMVQAVAIAISSCDNKLFCEQLIQYLIFSHFQILKYIFKYNVINQQC